MLLTNCSLLIKKFKYAPFTSTFLSISLEILLESSSAIICGDFLIILANLKQGNAKSPIS
jgi:hypothetical protein